MAKTALSFKNIDQARLLKVAVSTLRQVAEHNGVRNLGKALNLADANLAHKQETEDGLICDLIIPISPRGLYTDQLEQLAKLGDLIASNERGKVSFSAALVPASDGTKFMIGDGDDNRAFHLRGSSVSIWLRALLD